VGLTDFTRQTVIARREIAEWLQQEMWYWTGTFDIPAWSYYETDIWTAPADRRLVVEFFHPSASSRRFQGWVDLRDVLGSEVYRFAGTYLWGACPLALRYPLSPNHTLRIRIENYDPCATRRFRVAVEGYTEPV